MDTFLTKKRFFVFSLLLTLLVLMPCLYAQEDSVTPVPRPDKWWQERFQSNQERIQQGNVDVLFIGDSITHGWDNVGKNTWDEYYADRNVVNLGFSGDQTQHVLWRLENLKWGNVQPKLSMIMIGTNNCHHHTGEQIALGIEKIIDKLHTLFPDMKILLLAIFPRADVSQDKLNIIAEANKRIAEIPKTKPFVHFYDIGAEFLDENGTLPKTIMPDLLHPNAKGYEIWASAVEPKIAELLGEYTPENPPVGFVPLFNGVDLTGWKGLVADPIKRAKMSPEELAAAQQKADEEMRAHWKVVDGVLCYDGQGNSLCTGRDYEDYELLVDWKIEANGDSGIYLRGTPQVQIWDNKDGIGSGGLYNNEKNSSKPLVFADKPVGEWNRFFIRIIGDRVTVYLNDKLVVNKTVLENYWDRSQPLFPSGSIELQHHHSPLWFRNIYIREIPKGDGWKKLFNGKDLTGWQAFGGNIDCWKAEKGMLVTEGGEGCGWLATAEEYGDFELELEFRLPPGGNSGVFIRAPKEGNPAFEGSEIQILDDYSDQYKDLKPWQFCGSVYATVAPSRRVTRPAGEWQKYHISCVGSKVKVSLNGIQIIDADLNEHLDKIKDHPGLKRTSGFIGLQNHGTRLEFRNLRIRPL